MGALQIPDIIWYDDMMSIVHVVTMYCGRVRWNCGTASCPVEAWGWKWFVTPPVNSRCRTCLSVVSPTTHNKTTSSRFASRSVSLSVCLSGGFVICYLDRYLDKLIYIAPINSKESLSAYVHVLPVLLMTLCLFIRDRANAMQDCK